ncbi:hypothetical protein NLJ89_g11764 [Agrocybe chaxingu]|uniref:Uncharacterized protein n=1 Tax=Agrocybe chaxingu TaxID=84603 RepID=A0A9W8JRS2_9AGAR|nr:hypothetical protein NLJ89_g11764 [Agrocybe chaxingu]
MYSSNYTSSSSYLSPMCSSPEFPGLSLDSQTSNNAQYNQVADRIERMELADLLKNPHVHELFTNWKDTSQRAIRDMEEQKNLYRQINMLQVEVQRLRAELAQHQLQLSSQATSATPPAIVAAQTAATDRRAGNPSICPSKFPQTILWNIQDLSRAEFQAIKTSTRRIANAHLLSLGLPADPAAAARSKTKTYFQKYYPQQWAEALTGLEEREPVVGLCAANWKADHLLGNCLQAVADGDKENDQAPGKAKKRPRSPSGDDEDDEEEEREGRSQKRMNVDVEGGNGLSRRGLEEERSKKQEKSTQQTGV